MDIYLRCQLQYCTKQGIIPLNRGGENFSWGRIKACMPIVPKNKWRNRKEVREVAVEVKK
jgi:hypothetical protein